MDEKKSSSRVKIAAVVLAAGGARRMGKPKLLLPWQEKPLIFWPVKAALDARLDPVLVVTGANFNSVNKSLADMPVQLILNPDWEKGQSTSVICGINALPADADAVVILLGDQPRVSAEIIEKLTKEYRNDPTASPIIVTAFRGKRANPVLFDKSVFTELQTLQGDAGGRSIFSNHALRYINIDKSYFLLDIDSPEDYQNLSNSADGL